ncbi:reverse transcriptase [Trichonephila clavipes]|nr:reverse transcriptase [Trichonephila clavipes]
MAGLRPYSGSKVMLGSPAMKETIKKSNKESSWLNRDVSLTLGKAMSIISTYIDKYTVMTQNTKSFGKPWETVATVGPIPKHLERAEAVARFRLTTRHDFLGVYLHWLGVAPKEACQHCVHARIDSKHLLQCTVFNKYPADDIISRYWEARRQMVKKKSTSVG